MSVCLLKAPKRSLMQHKTLVNIVSSAKPSNVLSGENHTCSREIIKCCPSIVHSSIVLTKVVTYAAN